MGAIGGVRVPRRLVVLAPNWLGDAVMALPLLADVRRDWPDTCTTVAARAPVAPLFAMVPGVSDVIRLEGAGRHALKAARRNARLLEQGRFDAALLLPNSFLSAWIASGARIPERWGFARDLRGPLLTRAIPRPKKSLHQSEYYQALGAALGLRLGDRYAHLMVTDENKTRGRELLIEAGLADGRRFVVFAPGAAYGRAKRWLPERFAELATLFAEERITTVVVGATADAVVCREIAARARGAIDLCGRTDLVTLAAVLSLSEGTIANDSGAMHLAGAVGARVVAIFGPTDERQTSPLPAHADAPRPVIVKTAVWCRPCMLRACPIDHRCMTGVSARQVFEALAPG